MLSLLTHTRAFATTRKAIYALHVVHDSCVRSPFPHSAVVCVSEVGLAREKKVLLPYETRWFLLGVNVPRAAAGSIDRSRERDLAPETVLPSSPEETVARLSLALFEPAAVATKRARRALNAEPTETAAYLAHDPSNLCLSGHIRSSIFTSLSSLNAAQS